METGGVQFFEREERVRVEWGLSKTARGTAQDDFIEAMKFLIVGAVEFLYDAETQQLSKDNENKYWGN
jgi:phytoene/squalene synthetase